MNRRTFLRSAAATTASLALSRTAFSNTGKLTHKERVDRALAGQDVDRPPFTFYLHYKRPTAQLEAQDHLALSSRLQHRHRQSHERLRLPAIERPANGGSSNPSTPRTPSSSRPSRIIRDNLNGDAYFIDTLYGPYMTAMILFQSQPEYAKLGNSRAETMKIINDLHDFQRHHTDQWHTALEAITQSTINHIHRSKEIGSSGVLVSIFNSHTDYGPVSDYNRFSRPYDKRVIDALADTKLTVLHLHNLDRPYLDQFRDFNVPVLQYSVKESGIPIADARKIYSQTIAGGVDEIDFKNLTADQMRDQWKSARAAVGAKYIAAPGCSVPNSSTPPSSPLPARSRRISVSSQHVDVSFRAKRSGAEETRISPACNRSFVGSLRSSPSPSSPPKDPIHPAQTQASSSLQSPLHPRASSTVVKPQAACSHPAASPPDPCCCTPTDAGAPYPPQPAPIPLLEPHPACS